MLCRKGLEIDDDRYNSEESEASCMSLLRLKTFARQSELLNPLATFAFRFNFEMPIRQFYFTNRMFKHNNINLHL